MKLSISIPISISIMSIALVVQARSLTDALGSTSNSPSTIKNELTGDPKLACEAILCLSSAHRPGECNPSLHRYFSINHKKLKDTLSSRKNFLKKCPSSNEKNMDGLVNAITNGAGRCNAAELNRIMRYSVKETICPNKSRNRFGHGRPDDNQCYEVIKTYIKPSKPSYCEQYHNHEWTTARDKVQYVGTEKNGGHWIDR